MIEDLNQDKATKMVGYASGVGANDQGDGVGAVEDKSSGINDMVIGGLFCIGGTIATIADIGYIFWGAIVFGRIQFIRGLMKSAS